MWARVEVNFITCHTASRIFNDTLIEILFSCFLSIGIKPIDSASKYIPFLQCIILYWETIQRSGNQANINGVIVATLCGIIGSYLDKFEITDWLNIQFGMEWNNLKRIKGLYPKTKANWSQLSEIDRH